MENCTDAAALAPAATAYGGQSWALLDPRIILEEDKDLAADSSAVVCKASDGSKVHVRVSLHLAEPPASSYVQLRTDADVHVKPVLLSADGHMLLMRMVVARVRDPPLTWYEDNYFVFQARPDSGKEGRLRHLPDPQQSTDDHDDWVGHIGIACSSRSGGKDAWVVAGFRTRVVFGGHGVDDDEVGILSRFRPSSNKWEKLEDLRIPFDDGKGLYRFVWHSDDVIACNGLMFWIDYHRGMIYCDVFEDSPKLQYIPLPGIAIWDQDHDYSNGRQLPQAYRTVGVSRGQLKFIDIDDGLFGTRKTSGFKITTWSLNMTDSKWVEDHVLEVDRLWKLPNFRESGLPEWVPEYPVVDKKDTSILHFILRGRQSNAQAWIITLDMSNEALMTSYHPFKSKIKLVFEDPSVDTTQIFCDTPLISCDFDHLTKPTGSCADTSKVKCETTLVSTSKSKKRKSPSPAEDGRPYSADADMPEVNNAATRPGGPLAIAVGGEDAGPFACATGTSSEHVEEEAQRRFGSFNSAVEQDLLAQGHTPTWTESYRSAVLLHFAAALAGLERDLPEYCDFSTDKLWFIVRFTGPGSKGRKPLHHQGRWKEKSMKGMPAVADPSPQPLGQQRECYVGLKKTLEFDDNGNGNKWRAHEYTPFLPSDDGTNKLIPAEISLRIEFKEDEPPSSASSMKRSRNEAPKDGPKTPMKSPEISLRVEFKVDEPQPPPSSTKRSRSGTPKDGPKVPVQSTVWNHMTKVHVKVTTTTNADGSQRKNPSYKVMYAICHHCDKVFNADSRRHGTKHLLKHLHSCTCSYTCNCTHSH